MSRVRVLVIDGQGGGLGRQLTAALAAGCPDIELTAVGTNSIAASAMLKAGAHRAATGENAVVVNCRRADIIVGPIGRRTLCRSAQWTAGSILHLLYGRTV